MIRNKPPKGILCILGDDRRYALLREKKGPGDPSPDMGGPYIYEAVASLDPVESGRLFNAERMRFPTEYNSSFLTPTGVHLSCLHKVVPPKMFGRIEYSGSA